MHRVRGQGDCVVEGSSRESTDTTPLPPLETLAFVWLPVPADSEKRIQRSDFHIKDFHTSLLQGIVVGLNINNPGLESQSLKAAKIYILFHFPVSSRAPRDMKKSPRDSERQLMGSLTWKSTNSPRKRLLS